MNLCDMCEKNEATMAVCQPRPSDPRELCSIMYVCEPCNNNTVLSQMKVTTLDELIDAMKSGRTFAAPFKLFGELEVADRIEETGFLWLSV